MKVVHSAHIVALVSVSALLVVGCKKSATEPSAPASTNAAPAAVSAPATPAPTPASPSPAGDTPSGPTETAPVAAANGVKIAATSGKGLEWALKQDEIKNDAKGQWASAATASSCFTDCTGTGGYAAFQATGTPNVDTESDNSSAWATKTPDAGIEWLDLTFPKPVFADALRIRESFNAGAIVKLDFYDDHGKLHPLWSGNDPTRGLNYFMLTFPKTGFQTNRVKITLATNLVRGYNEVDAVQLIGEEK